MQIVFGLLFLLFFSACCLCVAACTRFDAALLPLPALCGSVVVLYLLSLLGLLQFGHFIIMAVWLAGGVYFGVRAGWRAIRQALFSPGFLLFVGGSCFLWVLFALQQPMFTQWDEFTAWGLAPKMVAERAALYVADPINLTASFTYPATSLVSYLFQRVPGQFYEWQCLAGLDILFLACIAPAAAMPRKNWAGAVLVFAAGFLLPFFFSVVPAGTPSTMYANAMADTPLALLFGGTLCLYAAAGGRKTGFFACAMPLAVLTMTKDIGFAYALIVTFLIGLDQLFGTPHPDTKPARIFGVSLAKCSILAAVVLAVFIRRRDPNRNHWGQRGQRGPELWCCADRRHQAAAGHWARRTLCPDHAEHGPGIFVPPRLFGGRAHHGCQLHSAAVHGGLCGSACRCRTPPHRGWLCGRGVLLCRAVSLPPDFVLLQFLRGRRLRLEGL